VSSEFGALDGGRLGRRLPESVNGRTIGPTQSLFAENFKIEHGFAQRCARSTIATGSYARIRN